MRAHGRIILAGVVALSVLVACHPSFARRTHQLQSGATPKVEELTLKLNSFGVFGKKWSIAGDSSPDGVCRFFGLSKSKGHQLVPKLESSEKSIKIDQNGFMARVTGAVRMIYSDLVCAQFSDSEKQFITVPMTSSYLVENFPIRVLNEQIRKAYEINAEEKVILSHHGLKKYDEIFAKLYPNERNKLSRELDSKRLTRYVDEKNWEKGSRLLEKKFGVADVNVALEMKLQGHSLFLNVFDNTKKQYALRFDEILKDFVLGDSDIFGSHIRLNDLAKKSDKDGFMVVVDDDWDIYFQIKKRGVIHHSSLAPHRTIAAGMLTVKYGRRGLNSWDLRNYSGHFHPKYYQTARLVIALVAHGFDLEKGTITFEDEAIAASKFYEDIKVKSDQDKKIIYFGDSKKYR